MDWKKWIIITVIVIGVTNIIALSTIPDQFIGLNIAMLAGMFSGVGFLAWWQNQNEQQSNGES